MCKKVLFLLLFFVVLLFNTNVYASNTVELVSNLSNSSLYEQTIYLPEFPVDVTDKQYFIGSFFDTTVCLYIVKDEYKDYKLVDTDDNGYGFTLQKDFNDSTVGYFDYYYISTSHNNLTNQEYMSNLSWKSGGTEVSTYGSLGDDVYSNMNIYYSNGNLFFFQYPETVGQAIQTVEMKETMKEIVEILPVIMIIVVSCLGLRKAFKALYNFLKTC